jgi:hypothetical protein
MMVMRTVVLIVGVRPLVVAFFFAGMGAPLVLPSINAANSADPVTNERLQKLVQELEEQLRKLE